MSRRNCLTARAIVTYVEHCESLGYAPTRRHVAHLFNDSVRGLRHTQNTVNKLLTEGRLSTVDSPDGCQRLVTPTLNTHT